MQERQVPAIKLEIAIGDVVLRTDMTRVTFGKSRVRGVLQMHTEGGLQ
ncbi:hypothetical protein QCM80_40455 [Bradyrhizobium sp. SSUT112]|nr:hypothetical protein [Bradyrhizobium sp. SSUT112]MDH2356843.1 hypothetical protein [Bradyrhizobium sp. SSUT112]